MTYTAHTFDTPIDRMVTVVDEDGAVVFLAFLNNHTAAELVVPFGPRVEWSADPCREVVEAVARWFDGERGALESLHLRPAGTAFSRQVWSEVREVPYGTTASYGEIARRLGRPGASRAVGRANATNPICLAIPCHRIVGVDGSLTGYGGGIATKQALLAFESGQRPLDLAGVVTKPSLSDLS
jgi:methylated-DNA-[protein]-cysteine S-methyltransferase